MNIENIVKEFFINDNKTFKLGISNLKFEHGKLYGIIGHSGSGKTTLLNILGLINYNYQGTYKIDDVDVQKLSDSELANMRVHKIGFVFQDFLLDENLTAIENVMLPMINNELIERINRKKIASDLLSSVGLDKRFNNYPKQLSAGEKQRVAIARALANNPDYILCDEPTGNLDKDNERKILNILRELPSKGKTVIVVSHSTIIKDYADVVIELNDGEVV